MNYDPESTRPYDQNLKTKGIITDDINGEPRFGKETRGINTTIKVWRRIS